MMQICIVFRGSLVIISFSFHILCVYFIMKVITLPLLSILMSIVGLLHVFRVNLCLAKAWDRLGQVWKLLEAFGVKYA